MPCMMLEPSLTGISRSGMCCKKWRQRRSGDSRQGMPCMIFELLLTGICHSGRQYMLRCLRWLHLLSRSTQQGMLIHLNMLRIEPQKCQTQRSLASADQAGKCRRSGHWHQHRQLWRREQGLAIDAHIIAYQWRCRRCMSNRHSCSPTSPL